MNSLVEGNDSLTTRQSQWLKLIVNHIEKVVVVIRINLDKHIKTASSVMTLHNLRNLTEFLYDLVKPLRILEEQTDIGTSLVAYFLRVDIKLASLQDAESSKFLYALMNRSSTDITCASHLKKRNSCISNDEFKDFSI